MKILHLSAGNLFGGVETLLVTLARQRGLVPEMESHFGVCYDGRLATELAATGAAVHRLPTVRISRPWTIWRGRTALRDLIRRERFDAVVCHSAWPLAVFSPAVRRAGVRVVLWVHGSPSRSWLERWALWTTPDWAIFNSKFIQGEIGKQFPEVRGTCIYCPVEFPRDSVDPAAVAAVRRELNTPPDAVVILQVSRMEPWKGHEHHLRALAKLPRDLNWRCWIAGGAQRPAELVYASRLQQLVRELGLAERVIFLGDRRDVPILMQAADIFCQPNSGPEPFGIVFIEALAAGRPVVTTAMGGALEIVDQSCGVLVPPHNVDALAESLLCLLTNDKQRQLFVQGGPIRAKSLCDPRMQMQRLCQTLVEQVRQTDAHLTLAGVS
jgi:glycosyltransferase involved in cell wall biosynthesis